MIGLKTDDRRREHQNLSRILKSALLGIDQVLDHPPYNLVIHTSPITETLNHFYQWHIEIMSKLAKVTGFEWGTGFCIFGVWTLSKRYPGFLWTAPAEHSGDGALAPLANRGSG